MQERRVIKTPTNMKTPIYDPKPAEKLIDKHQALSYPYECTFGGADLIITEGVFCPTLTNASPLLLKAIDFKSDERVLDVFAGSGVFGIIAALHGADVVTVDIAAEAVACTTVNASLNGVSDKVDARLGTMQDCIDGNETFDLIIANPPLLPGEPSDALSAALFDPGLQATIDFIRSLPAHLAKNGRCYLTISDVLSRYGYDIESLCTKIDMTASPTVETDLGYESYVVYKITHR